jgi:hypothetical protein
LGPSGFLEKLGVDGKANLNRPAQNFAGRRPDALPESVLQPILEEQIGHAHRECLFVQNEFSIAFEPKVEAWLADALSDILAQRRHDFVVAGRQGSLPGANLIHGVQDAYRPESRVPSPAGKVGTRKSMLGEMGL